MSARIELHHARFACLKVMVSLRDHFLWIVSSLLHVTGTTGTFLLGRAVEAPVPESYVVRGRLSPDGVPRSRVANVSVRVGGHKVRTGAIGRFEVRGRALGVVRVTMGDPRPPEDYRDRTVRFDDTWVALDGSGSYRLADIVVYWWDIA